MQLYRQASASPTRKWKFAGMAEVLTALAAVLAVANIDFTADEQTAVAGGVSAAVVVVGRIVAYFTHNSQ